MKVPEYSGENGVQFDWEAGFEIRVIVENNEIKISANKEGLISLAKHLLVLAQDTVPTGYHLHLDEYNSLEEGSAAIIIEKH